ncbi:MAG: 6-carboxytetrahydropterin synthase [Bryobacteraceae bacterium]
MTRLTRQYRFAASHRLHSASLSEDENQRIYGKCNNPYGHGHDYVLQVCAEGVPDPESGLLVNVGALDSLVEQKLMPRLRNRNLNDLEEFHALVPTTENLALVCEHWLRTAWGGRAALVGVRIHETRRNTFETEKMR